MGFLRKKSKKKMIISPQSPTLPTIHETKKKTTSYRQINVSVTAFLEAISEQKRMDLHIPHFVLHDFDDEEESKVIRMIFAHAHIPYETKTVQRDDFILEDYPFYCLPMLEVNDKKLGSVPSICRQLGWRYELSGYTHNDDSLVDVIGEHIFETRIRIKNWLDHIEHREEHECDELCQQSLATFLLIPLLENLEKILKNNDSPWLVGHTMTWADLIAACLFNPIIYHVPHLFDNFPNVYLNTKKVAELPVFTGFLYHVKDRSL